MNDVKRELFEKPIYTDDEINALADWASDLTIEQLMFLKDCHEQLMASQLLQSGQKYVC